MHDTGKRGRNWAANEKRKKLPKKKDLITVDGQGNVTGIGNDKQVGEFLDWLSQWAEDMHAWGQDVRDDIVRLEGSAGFSSGDPGDPPDGPPGED
ncbi:MAG: hypothetical protein ACWGSQ_07405 [Longimicrobiales bacterium]